VLLSPAAAATIALRVRSFWLARPVVSWAAISPPSLMMNLNRKSPPS
jgi:hypothetical protein